MEEINMTTKANEIISTNRSTAEEMYYREASVSSPAADGALTRKRIALICAIASTVITAGSFFLGIPGMAFLGAPMALVSYLIKPNGLGRALRSALHIGKVCWFLIPSFPMDILLGFVGMCFAGMVFFFLPALFVLKED